MLPIASRLMALPFHPVHGHSQRHWDPRDRQGVTEIESSSCVWLLSASRVACRVEHVHECMCHELRVMIWECECLKYDVEW